jgi:hypothetical protein
VGEIASITGHHTDIVKKSLTEELGVLIVREEHEGLNRQAIVLALSWYYRLLQTDSELPDDVV